eukprot:6729427-Prymnesium_polylepis.1
MAGAKGAGVCGGGKTSVAVGGKPGPRRPDGSRLGCARSALGLLRGAPPRSGTARFARGTSRRLLRP